MWDMIVRHREGNVYVVVRQDGMDVDAWKVQDGETVESVWHTMNTLYFS